MIPGLKKTHSEFTENSEDQRVANAADAPLSVAPQGGGVNQGNTGEV